MIAALSAAGGALCLFGVGVYTVMTSTPLQTRKYTPPILLTEQRMSGTTAQSSPNAIGASTSFNMPATVNSTDVGAPKSQRSQNFISALRPNVQRPPGANPNTAMPNTLSLDTPSPFAHPTVPPTPDGMPFAVPTDDPPPAARRTHPEPRHEQKQAVYRPASLPPAEAGPRLYPKPLAEAPKPLPAPPMPVTAPTLHYEGVLTTGEILRIKHSLRLSPDQETHWPPVGAALGEMGRQQIALIRRGQDPKIPAESWPPQRLYSVAGPLLMTLRPDQKDQVRRLCHSLGFDSVASMI